MSLAQVDPQDRRIRLDGATNFRDVGGYPTRDGATVRRGVVYRADALHALTPADAELLKQLRLRLVIDLRTERERAAEPCRVPWLRTLALPLAPEGKGPGDRAWMLEPDADLLGDLYRGILTESASKLGDVLKAIVAAEGVPTVVHCSAGKDRTGVVVAVLLSLLGVSEADVLDDYELSSQFRSEARVRQLVAMLGEAGVPDAVVAGLLGTPRPAMAVALAAARSRHGSIEGYLVEAAGLRDHDVRRLRELLLEP